MDWPEFDVQSGGDIEEFHRLSIEAFEKLNETYLDVSSTIWPFESGDGPATDEQSAGDGQSPPTHGGSGSEVNQWGFENGGGI